MVICPCQIQESPGRTRAFIVPAVANLRFGGPDKALRGIVPKLPARAAKMRMEAGVGMSDRKSARGVMTQPAGTPSRLPAQFFRQKKNVNKSCYAKLGYFTLIFYTKIFWHFDKTKLCTILVALCRI
jgi:hypothetical protein